MTVRCEKYTVKEARKDDPVWVDTVGWDDADLEDENTFKNILRYLKEKNLLRYGLVVYVYIRPKIFSSGLRPYCGPFCPTCEKTRSSRSRRT